MNRIVKHEVVSAATEIIREEVPIAIYQPPVQAEFVPTCKKCLRERNRNARFKQKNKRKQQVRANTPIVIQLKDTLKAALQQRQRNKAELWKKQRSETKDDGDVETDNSSERGDVVEVKDKKRKNVKNFSAFINVMEKAHRKEAVCVETNLTSDNKNNEKLVAEFVLNNASQRKSSSKSITKKRSIVNCENVEIICNDLNSIESALEDTTEESEIASTTSSSEIQSDSDISNTQDGPNSQEFTAEELQKLAEYTTGCPLIRYDCPPAQCPQCQWYNAQFYPTDIHSYYSDSTSSFFSAAGPKSTPASSSVLYQCHEVPSIPVDNDEVSYSDSEGVEEIAEQEILSESPAEVDQEVQPPNRHKNESSPWVFDQHPRKMDYNWSDLFVSHKQLLDIDSAGKPGKSSSKSRTSTSSSPPPDQYGVYVDLTDTDVSFEVCYHHNFFPESSSIAVSQADRSSVSTSVSSTGFPEVSLGSNVNQRGTHHHHSPYDPMISMPFYQYMTYWPSYYTPMFDPTTPFSLPNDVPKIMMIPPEELPKFNASQPPQRHWIPLQRPQQGKPAAIFTVMCYNVLCDKYCTRQQYGYCPSWGLNWNYRKKGIMDEIKTCAADIIGLQEVETDQFYNFFLPELERDGYSGIFSPKSRARTMTENERKHVDGCAIFYRTSKFSLIKEHLIEFNQLAMANAEGSDDMLNRVMTKDNIGFAALLETKEGVFDSGGGLPPEDQIKQPVLVATAHIHWDPEFSDVKLIQTMMLMSELKRIVEESYRSLKSTISEHVDCNAIPMIICGDLNSLPESGVIEYLTSGKVANNHIDFKELGYEGCLQTFNSNKDGETHLTHNFNLARAYDNEIMPATNYTYEFKGIIDYIFYSKSFMNLLGLLGPMDENWFRENKISGCPHPHIPSDHFSLFVEFEMPVPYPDDVAKGGASRVNGSSTSNSVVQKLR